MGHCPVRYGTIGSAEVARHDANTGLWRWDLFFSFWLGEPGLLRSGDSLLSGDFLHILSPLRMSRVVGEELELLDAELCFKENAFTALMGPCFVVDGDTFFRIRCDIL